MRVSRPCVAALILLVAPLEAARAPRLEVEAPPFFAREVAAIERLDRRRLAAITELVGLADPGPPIRVVLLPERTTEARQVPAWVSGYAVAEHDLVVLLPERVPRYPDRSLANLLHHEVAHVLLARATGGAAVPRWFNEGLALLASRDMELSDRSRVLLGGLRGAEPSTAALERAFGGGEGRIQLAYALSGALVEDLVRRHGRASIAAIAAELAAGRDFPDAFAAATGVELAVAEDSFWRRFRFWYRWVPFLTSGATLWLAITLLSLAAVARIRRRNRKIEERWEAEEAAAEGEASGRWQRGGPRSGPPGPADDGRGR